MKSKRETIEMAKLALFNSQTKLEVLEKQKQELLGKYANATEEEKPELEEQMKINQQEFQNLQAQLIQQNQKLQEVKDKMGDVKSKTDPQLIQEAQNIETQIQETTKQLHSYLNGEISPYVIRDTIFQLNPLFNDIFIPASFEQYVKTYKGKDIKDLSDSEQKSYWEEYKDYNME